MYEYCNFDSIIKKKIIRKGHKEIKKYIYNYLWEYSGRVELIVYSKRPYRPLQVEARSNRITMISSMRNSVIPKRLMVTKNGRTQSILTRH